jgi:hypothetical protein
MTMDLQKLVELLLIPILASTVLLQVIKQGFASEKTPDWMTLLVPWIRLIAIPIGIGVTWLFADLINYASLLNLQDLTPRTLVALGFVVGLASIGGFEGLSKIPVINTVIK